MPFIVAKRGAEHAMKTRGALAREVSWRATRERVKARSCEQCAESGSRHEGVARKISTDDGRAALSAVAAAAAASVPPPRTDNATAVRYLLQLLAEKAPATRSRSGCRRSARCRWSKARGTREGHRRTSSRPTLRPGSRSPRAPSMDGCRGRRPHQRLGHARRHLRPAPVAPLTTSGSAAVAHQRSLSPAPARSGAPSGTMGTCPSTARTTSRP